MGTSHVEVSIEFFLPLKLLGHEDKYINQLNAHPILISILLPSRDLCRLHSLSPALLAVKTMDINNRFWITYGSAILSLAGGLVPGNGVRWYPAPQSYQVIPSGLYVYSSSNSDNMC